MNMCIFMTAVTFILWWRWSYDLFFSKQIQIIPRESGFIKYGKSKWRSQELNKRNLTKPSILGCTLSISSLSVVRVAWMVFTNTLLRKTLLSSSTSVLCITQRWKPLIYLSFIHCGQGLKQEYAGRWVPWLPFENTVQFFTDCGWQEDYHRVDVFPSPGVEIRYHLSIVQ